MSVFVATFLQDFVAVRMFGIDPAIRELSPKLGHKTEYQLELVFVLKKRAEIESLLRFLPIRFYRIMYVR